MKNYLAVELKIFRKRHGEFKSIRVHDNFRNKGMV